MEAQAITEFEHRALIQGDGVPNPGLLQDIVQGLDTHGVLGRFRVQDKAEHHQRMPPEAVSRLMTMASSYGKPTDSKD